MRSSKDISGDNVQDGLEAVSGEYFTSLDERWYCGNGKEVIEVENILDTVLEHLVTNDGA